MKTISTYSGVLAILAAQPWVVYANAQGMAGIQEKLESEYQVTKTNDDKTDIVTAGSVVVLHKDRVLMVAATSAANPCMNTYKSGKISPIKACGVGKRILSLPVVGSRVPGADKAPATRSFVAGEKFWVTRIDVKDSGKKRGVVLDFFSDATPPGDQGIRYKGVLTIPFGALTRTPDDALKLVAEVITVVPPEDAKDSDKAQAATQGGQQETSSQNQAVASATTTTPAEPTPMLIAPPPPPPPDAVGVSEGQTMDQIVAEMGQPLQKFKAGGKEIYVYKNLKVTFVSGKVKDVE